MSLRILTLGPPRIELRGKSLVDLPTQRLRFALLVYIATERDVSRESVLSMFWPERDASRAKHALRQMLYELRQLLGEDWLDQQRDRLVVRAAVDAHDFDHAVAEQHVEAALSLYNGDFLQGFTLDNHAFDAWVERQRVQYGRRHRKLRRDHVTDLLAAGRKEAALKSAQRWVELDPLEDEANHALIHCLALSGQRVAALQTYESYERQLAAELQVEPLEDTRALVERIRAGELTDPAVAPVPDPAAIAPTPPAAVDRIDASDVASTDVGPTDAPRPHLLAEPKPRAALPPGRAAGWRNRGFGKVAVAASVVAVLALVALVLRVERRPPASATTTTRVVVLPFTDHTDDGSLIPLANALTEALARSLAQTGPLEVVSPSGVAALREQGLAMDSLRRLFGGDFVITGSLDERESTVMVNVELLDGANGALLKSERLERSASQSRMLVDDVVDTTAGILRREVGQRVAVRRGRLQTNSEEAWRLMLEARTQQDRLTRLFRHHDFPAIEQTLDRADSLLARAAELDRRWSEPVVMRGWLMERRALLAAFSAGGDTAAYRKAYEAARSLAVRALERDSEDPRAWELRGSVYRQLALLPGVSPDTAAARLKQAEQDLRRAALLDPLSASAWRALAELQFTAGRYAEAKNSAERAWETDRYSADAVPIITVLFNSSVELGEDADARRWCAEARRRRATAPPSVYCLFVLHAFVDEVPPEPALLRGEIASLRASSEAIQPQLVSRLELLLAAAFARAGQADSARAILARAPASEGGSLWLQAGVHAALREDDLALARMKDFLAVSSADRLRVARTRPFWRYRGHPDYERMLRER
jgi:DNA-binding SARP family transcriptional activator/TolB-like protein